MSQDDLNPAGSGGPRGDKTLGALTAPQYRWGEDGQVWGGGDENPPTARNNREQLTDGGDGTARRGVTAMEDAEMETT